MKLREQLIIVDLHNNNNMIEMIIILEIIETMMIAGMMGFQGNDITVSQDREAKMIKGEIINKEGIQVKEIETIIEWNQELLVMIIVIVERKVIRIVSLEIKKDLREMINLNKRIKNNSKNNKMFLSLLILNRYQDRSINKRVQRMNLLNR